MIPLPPAQELHALFSYDPLTGALTWKERPPTTRANKCHNSRDAGQQVGAIDGWGHRQVRVRGRLSSTHRIIWKMMSGKEPKEQIDHINGQPSDNRWENLREATATQNAWNRTENSNNTSDHPCIYPLNTKRAASKKFRLRMRLQGTIYVKDFHTIEEANAAYEFAFASFRDVRFKRNTT